MKHLSLLILLQFLLSLCVLGQDEQFVKGRIQAQDTQEALPYASLLILHRHIGTISNERGYFSLNVTQLQATDTIVFQYIGYQTKRLLVGNLDSLYNIYLEEDLINLSEVFVFGNPLEARAIVKKVIANKNRNYQPVTAKTQSFIRWRNTSDIGAAEIDLKKNTIEELDEASLKKAAENIPKHQISYVDFLGDLYFSSQKPDSLKIEPIRLVSLKEEEIAELEQMANIFEKLFKKSDERDYWKVKTGILSQKLNISEPVEDDSINQDNEKFVETQAYNNTIRNQLTYSLLNDKYQWEFLYHTGKYEYTLVGGTKVKGEDVYIIEFEPKSSGLFKGRVYISMHTYALIRADYEYAPGKSGKSFQLFGVGYSMNHFSGTIYFEKQEHYYRLKYFSLKTGQDFSVNRTVSLLKKRKRFLFDKTLKNIKVDLGFEVSSMESIEVLFLKSLPITQSQYERYEQKQKMRIIYTDHFDDNLWKGYPIIEPTKRMRTYVKP